MYLEFFRLAKKPFSKTPDPAFLYPSRQHAEALARLSHAVEEREIAVLTGEIGAGKTTLSRKLVDEFADTCRFTLVVNPKLPPAQLVSAIAEGFGVPREKRKADAVSRLAEVLAEMDEAGVFPVAVIDEAQLLQGHGAFDELRLLTNLTADDRPLLGLLLLGQPELRERVAAPAVEAFRQRVGVSYHLGPLDEEETGRYLAHRLAVAGREEPLFTFEAVSLVHQASGGIPRLVNKLAANALLEGFSREAEEIDSDIVRAAIRDVAAFEGAGARA